MPRKSKSDDGQLSGADEARVILPSSPPEDDKGQLGLADEALVIMPLSSHQSGEGQRIDADRAVCRLPSSPPDIEQTVSSIRYWHRQRVYAMEQRKRADLSLLAFLRSTLGWSKALPDAERAKIAKKAMSLVALCEAEAKGKEVDTSEPAYVEWRDIIAASLAARAPFDVIESRAVKQMGKLAHELPIYEWAAQIRGLGDVSLAVIVAEAGDLANYATHSKLWKRMGVAVMGDVRQGELIGFIRQGGLPKNASKEAWIAHGYNRQRRSRLWNIGDALIKAQVRKVLNADGEDDGERTSIGDYGAVYLNRKAYELVREPDMQPIKAHRRAQRYMEKRLLRNLWRAWRDGQTAKAELLEMARELVPPVQQNERKAEFRSHENAFPEMPSAHSNEEMATTALPTLADLVVPSPQPKRRKASSRLPKVASDTVPSAYLN